MTADTEAMQVLRIVEQRGLVRSRDLTAAQIPRATLMRLVRAGRLKQIARGLYALPGQPLSRQHSLAEVAARSSARASSASSLPCAFTRSRCRHARTDHLAGDPEQGPRSRDDPPLCVLRFSGAALTEGVEQHVIDGVTIRVYSVAKTVADCFEFREQDWYRRDKRGSAQEPSARGSRPRKSSATSPRSAG